MSWKDILKNFDTPQRWFIKTDEFTSAIPDNLVNQLGSDPTEKLAEAYKNGYLVDLKRDTYYELENGKIKSINVGNTKRFYEALSNPNIKFRRRKQRR